MGVDDFSRIFSHEGRRGVSNARRGRWLAPQTDYRCNGPWNYLPFYPPELGVFLHCAEERKDRIQLTMPLFIELLVPPGCNTSFVPGSSFGPLTTSYGCGRSHHAAVAYTSRSQ